MRNLQNSSLNIKRFSFTLIERVPRLMRQELAG